MSSRPKKKRYSLEEVEDILMNDPDSGDSDLDLGEDFAALDIKSNREKRVKMIIIIMKWNLNMKKVIMR